MNKIKLIVVIVSGVMGVLVLGAIFMTYQAYSSKTAVLAGNPDEGIIGYNDALAKVQSLFRQKEFPSERNISLAKANQEQVVNWMSEALKFVQKGDRIEQKVTREIFKEFIVGDSQRLIHLKSEIINENQTNDLAKADFSFGPFKDYIKEGKLPTDTELIKLQRQWDDVSLISELLAKSQVSELMDVQFKAQPVVKKENETKSANKKGRKAGQKNVKEEQPLTDAQSYIFTFTAKPNAFVNVLNELVKCERFIVVDDFTFSRGTDVLAAALGLTEKSIDSSASETGRRSRRRAKTSSDEKDTAGEKKTDNRGGVVTDPTRDAILTVVLTVTVHDFRSLVSTDSDDAKEGK